MKLRTSYFNTTALQKNFTRFAPAWVLYGVMWLLILIMMLQSDNAGYYFAANLAQSLQIMPVPNCLYALLCAQLLFGDLYNSRMCNSLHALPMRREGWFFTNVASGIGFSVLPNLAIMLLSTLFLENWWAVAPMWMLGMTLQYLFFFGVAVLSVYCVGNRFAMALVYAILNCISLIIFALLESLYVPMLYGLVINTDPFLFFSPVGYMMNYEYLSVEKIADLVTTAPGWGYLAACAAVGLAFMGLGLLLYRKRNLERAGDFITVRGLAPVFMLLYCLCGGMAGYLFFSLFIGDDSMFFLIVGMTVGWFTGNMLLKRTVRVFRKRSIAGCAVFLLAFFLSLGLTSLDPLGITRWVPEVDKVESLCVSTGTYMTEDIYHTDPAQIRQLLEVHRYGIENRNANFDNKVDLDVTLKYTMKNGATAQRKYTVNVEDPVGQQLQKLFSGKEYVLGAAAADMEAYLGMVVSARTYDDFDIYDKKGLLEALVKDCEAGTMAQEWVFRRDEEVYTYIELRLETKEDNARHYQDIRIYGHNVHTVKWLKDHGYTPENEDTKWVG